MFHYYVNSAFLFLSEKCLEIVETLRETCGGFGFHAFAGFAQIIDRILT